MNIWLSVDKHNGVCSVTLSSWVESPLEIGFVWKITTRSSQSVPLRRAYHLRSVSLTGLLLSHQRWTYICCYLRSPENLFNMISHEAGLLRFIHKSSAAWFLQVTIKTHARGFNCEGAIPRVIPRPWHKEGKTDLVNPECILDFSASFNHLIFQDGFLLSFVFPADSDVLACYKKLYCKKRLE